MEYEKCFQPLQEKGASQHLIVAEDCNLLLAVNTLVEMGKIVGQGTLLEQDVIYFLNPERPNPALALQKPNGEPLYLTPEERLKRPTSEELRLKRGGRVL